MKMTRDNLLFGMLLGWSVVATGVTVKIQLDKRRDQQRAAERNKPTSVSNWRRLADVGYAVGPTSAAKTVVIFSDFQCPFCRRFATVIDTLKQKYPDVRIVERQFPLPMHQSAFAAALAAECAKDLGHYDEMRRELFRSQDLVADERWGALAKNAGIADSSSVVKCVSEQRHAAAVRVDMAAGKEIGVSGTPAFLVNDSLFAGAMPLASLVSHLGGSARSPR
jgi:protein-disulfide isomerase